MKQMQAMHSILVLFFVLVHKNDCHLLWINPQKKEEEEEKNQLLIRVEEH